MTAETEALLKLCECPEWAGMKNPYTDGREYENARLLPILKALCEDRERLRAWQKRAEGFMFAACQPDKGDMFSQFDEENLKVRAASDEMQRELLK